MDKHIEMEQLISAYHDGEVTLREKADVEEHLKGCASCRAYYLQLQKISSSLATWSDQDLSPDLEQKIANRIFQKGSGNMDRVNQRRGISAALMILMVFCIYSINDHVKRGSQGRLRSAMDDIGDRFSTKIVKEDKKIGPLAGLKQKIDQYGERRFQGRIRDAGQYLTQQTGEIGSTNQYEPYSLQSDYSVNRRSSTEQIADSPGTTNYLLAKTKDTFARGATNSVLSSAEGTDAQMNQDIAHVETQSGGRKLSALDQVSIDKAEDGVRNKIFENPSLPMSGHNQFYFEESDRDESGKLFGKVVGGVLITREESVDSSGYPAQLNREQYESPTENVFLSVLDQPLSTFSIDVDTASYANIRRFINSGQLPPPDAVRLEEMINYFNYDFPQPEGEHPFEIVTEAGGCPWNPKHPLVMIGLQGKTVALDNLPPSNLVFLIDVSGSMNEPNKLPLLKASFKMLVNQLRSSDRVAIVVYAGNAGLVLESTSGQDKERIFQAIDSLTPGGSTAGGAGIELAYRIAQQNFQKEGNNRVILATDGDFNVGVSGDDELVKIIEEKRSHGVFLSVLGFGSGNLQDAKMEKLADKGNGNYSYIDNILEGEKVFVHELGGTLLTIAKDVKIQIEFNPSQVKAYRLLGYENRMLAKEDFNDDLKDAGELGSGHQVMAFYELIPAGSDEQTGGVDPLKYQQVQPTEKQPTKIVPSDDLLTIKLRYKKPDEDQSRLIDRTMSAKDLNQSTHSGNFRFAAAVAEAGLLFKNSRYKAQASFQQVLELAQGSVGEDSEGYRSEFVKLIRMAMLLAGGVIR